jgi:PAS domain-containing protein
MSAAECECAATRSDVRSPYFPRLSHAQRGSGLAQPARGFDLSETPREVSFCNHVVAEGTTIVVPDATSDPRFRDSPCVRRDPRIPFYAGVPLETADGHVLGTLCAIDYRPRELSARERRILEMLARQVMVQLEMRVQLRAREEAETRLQSTMEWQQLLLDALPDLYFSISTDDRFTDFHGGTATELLTPKEPFLGKRIADVLPPDLAASMLAALDRARKTGEMQAIEHSLCSVVKRQCRRASPGPICSDSTTPTPERCETQRRRRRTRAGASPVRLRGRDGERCVEIEVHDDPRDPAHRLLFLHDVTEMRRLEARVAEVRRGDMVGASSAMEAMFRRSRTSVVAIGPCSSRERPGPLGGGRRPLPNLTRKTSDHEAAHQGLDTRNPRGDSFRLLGIRWLIVRYGELGRVRGITARVLVSRNDARSHRPIVELPCGHAWRECCLPSSSKEVTWRTCAR